LAYTKDGAVYSPVIWVKTAWKGRANRQKRGGGGCGKRKAGEGNKQKPALKKPKPAFPPALSGEENPPKGRKAVKAFGCWMQRRNLFTPTGKGLRF
jgi:hypothetical protein